MTTEMKIHGLPQPPLGYRYATPGDERTKGILMLSAGKWEDCPGKNGTDLFPTCIYAIPLNDDYDYFEAGTTTLQPGDECLGCLGDWAPYYPPCESEKNATPLRRPKAKPPTYLERQAVCGLKIGDRVRVVRHPIRTPEGPARYEQGWNGGGWAGWQKRYVGEVGTITIIYNEEFRSGYALAFEDGPPFTSTFPYFILEKVEEPGFHSKHNYRTKAPLPVEPPARTDWMRVHFYDDNGKIRERSVDGLSKESRDLILHMMDYLAKGEDA